MKRSGIPASAVFEAPRQNAGITRCFIPAYGLRFIPAYGFTGLKKPCRNDFMGKLLLTHHSLRHSRESGNPGSSPRNNPCKGGFETRPYGSGIRRLAVSRRRTPTIWGLPCKITWASLSTVETLGFAFRSSATYGLAVFIDCG